MNVHDSDGRIDSIILEAVLCQLVTLTEILSESYTVTFLPVVFSWFFFSHCLSLEWLLG